MNKPLKQFTLNNQEEPVIFIESLKITKGVTCDIYSFPNDTNKDLGIIHIQPGCKTPLQKVLQGEKTIEGYISGKGRLIVTRKNGNEETYAFDETLREQPSVTIVIGDTMQWQADMNTLLEAYEIYFPPYADGRYENIKE